jgi:hypothetical protein
MLCRIIGLRELVEFIIVRVVTRPCQHDETAQYDLTITDANHCALLFADLNHADVDDLLNIVARCAVPD